MATFSFSSPTTNPFGINLGSVQGGPSPTFADINGDGDLDLFIGEKSSPGSIHYFENTGTSSNPSFAAPVTSFFGGHLEKSTIHLIPA